MSKLLKTIRFDTLNLMPPFLTGTQIIMRTIMKKQLINFSSDSESTLLDWFEEVQEKVDFTEDPINTLKVDDLLTILNFLGIAYSKVHESLKENHLSFLGKEHSIEEDGCDIDEICRVINKADY